jgi:hypothetical protein
VFACQDHAESELFGEGRLCRIAYSQAARAFGIRSPHTVIMRSRRDRWPIPSRVEERALIAWSASGALGPNIIRNVCLREKLTLFCHGSRKIA